MQVQTKTIGENGVHHSSLELAIKANKDMQKGKEDDLDSFMAFIEYDLVNIEEKEEKQREYGCKKCVSKVPWLLANHRFHRSGTSISIGWM